MKLLICISLILVSYSCIGNKNTDRGYIYRSTHNTPNDLYRPTSIKSAIDFGSSVIPKISEFEVRHLNQKIPYSKPTKDIKYTIRRGDTLSGIGKRFGISYKKIASYNGFSVRKILRVGKKIIIPGGKSIGNKKVSKIRYTKDYYVVREGDNPWNIAKKLNVSWNELKRINNFHAKSLLRIGQKIVIPRKVKNIKQTVKSERTHFQPVIQPKQVIRPQAIKITPTKSTKSTTISQDQLIKDYKAQGIDFFHTWGNGKKPVKVIAKEWSVELEDLLRYNLSLKSKEQIPVKNTKIYIPIK